MRDYEQLVRFPTAVVKSPDVVRHRVRLSRGRVARDPHPCLRELFEQCPVHHGSISGIFGLVGPDNFLTPDDQQVSVFGFEAVDRGFRDPLTLSSSYYEPLLGAVIGRTILQMDPPEHQRFRTLLQGAFSKKEMIRWGSDFGMPIVAWQLDRLAGHGSGDLGRRRVRAPLLRSRRWRRRPASHRRRADVLRARLPCSPTSPSLKPTGCEQAKVRDDGAASRRRPQARAARRPRRHPRRRRGAQR